MQAVLAGLEAYKTTAAQDAHGPPSQAAAAGSAAAAAKLESRPGTSRSITVKFLLSIDRRNDTEAAMDTVSLGYLSQGPARAAPCVSGHAGDKAHPPGSMPALWWLSGSC